VGNFKTNRRKCSVPGTWRVGDTLRARLGTRLSCIMRLLHRQKHQTGRSRIVHMSGPVFCGTRG
jgi:hypothetical protein